ncbi:MAG: S8 family serine peptidase, partial [Thermoproteota archaeon]|nr:S8 family serine peptidase [Thermoproteota archaeon]
IVTAVGNDGNDTWHYVETPGDADSALTVGAVDINRQPAYFSSYGPNSNGQTKPDVAAIGLKATVADPNTGQPVYNNGTSFATPIITGLATCLWQAFPEVSNMDIIDVLRKASDKANNPDNRTGYGIPDMKKAFVLLIKKLFSKQFIISNCKTILKWTAKSASDMNFVMERKLSTENNYQPVDTQFMNSKFATNNFIYSDDISMLSPGSIINYRIKMNIATDTSFYLDSAIVTTPELTAATINGFGRVCIGNTSTDSFIINGKNLLANNIEIDSSNGYSYAITLDGSYSSSLSIIPPGETYSQTIYVKFTPDSIGNFNGNIPVSYNCNSINIPVFGSGVYTLLTTVTTDTVIVLSTHNTLLKGTIISAGCNPVAIYGFEYSSNIDFANDAGIKILANNLIAGKFTAMLSGLAQHTTYYYKAFAVGNDSVTYGSEHSFTTLAIPNELVIYPNPALHSGTTYYSVNGIIQGHYEVHIYNSIGQLVFNKEINPQVNFIDDSFVLPVYLSAGLYSLQIIKPGFNIEKRFIIR